jgi:hypothetical protein
LLAAVALTPGVSAASDRSGIATGFADPYFLNGNAQTRSLLLNRSVNAGASYARIVIGWARVAPTEPLNPTHPADPAYNFRALDAAVRDADHRGLRVLFTLHSAPPWATEGTPDGQFVSSPESWRPKPAALGQFAQALAIRYSGKFTPPHGTEPLPRVSLVEPWNEPNLTAFLSPQWEGGQLVAADRYREMLNAVYAAYHSVQPRAKVIAGATGPEGDPGPGRRTAPLKFLRALLCLHNRKKLEPLPCPDPAHFDVLSHHPISPFGEPPSKMAPGTDDAGVREMKDIRKMLRTAERQQTVLPAISKRPLWATEIWWETSPPTTLYEAPSKRRQARDLAEALKMLWEQGVPVALFFQVRDDKDVGGPPRSGWGTGVFYADDTPKPSFSAVRMPLVAERLSPDTVSVWVRSPVAGQLRIKAGDHVVARFRVAAGDVVKRRLQLSGPTHLIARIDGEDSLRARVPGGRRAAH